jgi:hypothetical protein
MPTAYVYPDAYLARFCDTAREDRAQADIARVAAAANVTFDADWLERLTIVQCYVLACLENQADAEDLFSAKLKNYRGQLETLTLQAIAAARSTAGTVSNIGIMSVPLERA